LAQVAAAGGEEVLLWAREPDVVAAVNADALNPLFLPGVPLSRSIRATGELAALDECGALLIVSPAQHMRSVLAALPSRDRPLVLCSKGIEEASGLLMHEVAHEVQPDAPLAVLSGPTLRMKWRRGCRPPSRWLPPPTRGRTGWRGGSPSRSFGLTCRRMWSVPRSAGR
jgi:glycerol-3-phosphate dehydrogenase (NAD(P)+)